jgi:glucose-6-phosphate-specific signal transduction histidine kinase
MLLALFMHLLPVFVLLAGLAFAWRWPWVGAVVIAGFSLCYLIVFGGRFP